MGFRIERARPEDAPILGKLMLEASTSPRIVLEFKECKTEDWLDWHVQRIEGEILGCEEYPDEAVALKAVDEETGEIAGVAVWGWSQRAADLILQRNKEIALPNGANTQLRQTFISKLFGMEEQNRPDGLFYELCELATSSKFRRRGLGSLFVEYGLERADREGVVCFLSASPMGVPVYSKLGFEEVGRLEMGLGEWGGEGKHVHVAMIRRPVGRGGV